MRLENFGAAGQIVQPIRATSADSTIAFGGQKFASADPNGFQYPTGLDWYTNLNQKFKLVEEPPIISTFNSSATVDKTGLLTRPPHKTLKMTIVPWRVEKIPFKQYISDTGYVTNLAATPQSPSTITNVHWVDLFAFPAYYLQTANIHMSCRVYITVKCWGYFNKPVYNYPGHFTAIV